MALRAQEGLLRDTQLTSFSAGMTELVSALGGVHKVDTMVRPSSPPLALALALSPSFPLSRPRFQVPHAPLSPLSTRQVLPFPYCQLLRWSLIIFCFTLPFVMAEDLGYWTVPVTVCTTCVLYGLDEVGPNPNV